MRSVTAGAGTHRDLMQNEVGSAGICRFLNNIAAVYQHREVENPLQQKHIEITGKEIVFIIAFKSAPRSACAVIGV